MAYPGSSGGSRFGGLRKRGGLWKSGWRGRAGAAPTSFRAFTNMSQIEANYNFYMSQIGATPYQFRFASGQFYVAMIIHLPEDFSEAQNIGIAGNTYADSTSGWSIDMDTSYLLGFNIYGSNSTLYRDTTTLAPGFTYILLLQVYVDSGTGRTILACWLNGVSLGTTTLPAGVTFNPSLGFGDGPQPFCLGQTQPDGTFTPPGTLRIVGIVGGDISAPITQPMIDNWDDFIRATGSDIPFLSDFGASATNEDRYTAESVPTGVAPNPYTSETTGELLEWFTSENAIDIDVVRFTPNYAS